MKNLLIVLFFFSFSLASVNYEGIVYSKEEVKLSLPLDGIIRNIYLKDGAKVKKDEVILKLDDSLQKLEVLRKQEILKDDSEYNANKSNLKIVKELYSSTKALYDKTASVSKDELNNLLIQYQNLEGKVNTYASKKKLDELDYNIAKEVLNKYTLKSPIDGMITDLKYNEGEWIKMGEVVLTVVDIDNCYVELNIDEPIARELKQEQKVIVMSNMKNIKKEGYITYIAPQAESKSALVKIKIRFKNENPKITPGVVAEIIFDEGNISAK